MKLLNKDKSAWIHVPRNNPTNCNTWSCCFGGSGSYSGDWCNRYPKESNSICLQRCDSCLEEFRFEPDGTQLIFKLQEGNTGYYDTFVKKGLFKKDIYVPQMNKILEAKEHYKESRKKEK